MARHDATGRTRSSRGKSNNSLKPSATELAKVKRMPDGETFVQLWQGLLQSEAWRAQGINCRRFVEFLIVEHLSHGGCENGNLAAPFRQLVEWGIGTRHVRPAIDQAVHLGLVEIMHHDTRKGTRKDMSRYRLTFLASREIGHGGRTYFNMPSFQPTTNPADDVPTDENDSGALRK